MPFKFSRCILLQTPKLEELVEFYNKVFGLQVADTSTHSIELATGSPRLFLDREPASGIVMEFLVPDLEKAKEEVLAAGCTILTWEGKGKPCYIRDPFGFTFNLYEEPEAFNTPLETKA